MINAILGIKAEVGQQFTQDGKLIPVTRIKARPCWVAQLKNKEKDGYQAVKLGWGEKKSPLFLAEIRVDEPFSFKKGDPIEAEAIFQPGDKLKVTGWSKGKGFAGVMKRWGFKGGPRTHGQSDRQRSPGSIGQTTTPGRVYRGKKMAGRMGNDRVTISGLILMAVDKEGLLLVKGLVPGPKRGFLIVKKVGQVKKFIPLMKSGEKKIQETEEEKALRLEKEKKAVEELKKVEKVEGKENAAN